ncbi:peptidase family C50-domain-containing protein [Melampsora americana]|nr:peptidase family C50-domain-containing protein [Melampsora americana]
MPTRAKPNSTEEKPPPRLTRGRTRLAGGLDKPSTIHDPSSSNGAKNLGTTSDAPENAKTTSSKSKTLTKTSAKTTQDGRYTSTRCKTSTTEREITGLTQGIREMDVNGHKHTKTLEKKQISKLVLKPTTTKAALPDSPTLSISEQCKLAMKAINIHLTKLAEIHRSGWKADGGSDLNISNIIINGSKSHSVNKASGGWDVSQVLRIIDDCASALYALRKFHVAGTPLIKLFDVERAGLALVNHALELRLYNSALRMLDVAHIYLQSLVSPSTTSTMLAIRPKSTTATPIPFESWQDFSSVLSFDLSELDPNSKTNPDHVSLLATAVAQGFQAFLKATSSPPKSALRKTNKSSQGALPQSPEIRANCCIKALDSPKSLSHWSECVMSSEFTHGENACSLKILTAAQASYTTVVKACATWDDTLEPERLFQLRKSAIISLLACQVQFRQFSAVDLLMDQARRSLLIYARSRPDDFADVVLHIKEYITEIICTARTYLQTTHDSDSGWIGLCQAVANIARKAGDLDMLEHIAPFLQVDHSSVQDKSITSVEREHTSLPKEMNLLMIKLVSAGAALEHFNKTGEDRSVCTQLEKSILSLSVIYCHQSTLPKALLHKFASSVERMRRLCVGTIRRRGDGDGDGKEGARESVNAACCSVLVTILDVWHEEMKKCSAQTPLDQACESPTYYMMLSGSIESLICLAEFSFKLTLPQTHRQCLDRLERCKSLIKLLRVPDVSTIRCITSVYYNAGVSLYHADKHVSAIAFLKHACSYPNEMFNITGTSQTCAIWTSFEDNNHELDELRLQLIKRWELLALCHLGTDKALAHSAYISAILSYALNSFETLGRVCGKNADNRTLLKSEPGLCKLIQRVTRLATWDLLLADHDCSLFKTLAAIQLPPSAIGGVLEVQLNFLYSNIRKAECRPAIKAILVDCLTVYESTQYPLRRARTLCRLMELHLGNASDSQSLPLQDTLNILFDEIKTLCHSSNCAEDLDLARYRSQYIAFGHIWIALAAQQTCKPVEFLNASKSAIIELQAITHTLASLNTKSHQVSRKQTPSSPRRKNPSARTRNLDLPTSTLPNLLKTPAPKNGFRAAKTSGKQLPSNNDEETLSCKVDWQSSSTPVNQPLDDLERHLQHLRLFSHVLAVHGLIHSKLAVLQLLRQIYQHWSSQDPDDPIPIEGATITKTDMSLTFLQLEDTKRAGHALEMQPVPHSKESILISRASESALTLLRSRYLSDINEYDQAKTTFTSAYDIWTLAEAEEDDLLTSKSQVSSTNRVIKRTKALYMNALASSTYSYLEENTGDLNSAIDSILRAIRLFHRASSNILRISSPPTTAPELQGKLEDVFGSGSGVKDCVPLPEAPRETRPGMMTLESHPVGELTWQIAEAMAQALRRATTLYLTKGSPRMAEGYLIQLLQFATKFGSTRLQVSGMGLQAEMMTLKGEYDDARTVLADALTLLGEETSPELAEIWRLRSSLSYRLKSYDEAREHSTATCHILRKLEDEEMCSDDLTNLSKSVQTLSLKSRSTTRTLDQFSCILSTIAARAVYVQARVSRDRRRVEELAEDLLILSKMPCKAREKVFETTLVALTELDDVLQNYRVDPLLGVLPEAMIAIPPQSSSVIKSTAKKDDIPRISQAIKIIERTLCKRTIECATVWNLQETVCTLMTLKFIRCILGRAPVNAAGEVAALMDFASSITLRREMLDIVRAKLHGPSPVDDTLWPSINPATQRSNSLADEDRCTLTRQHWVKVQQNHMLDSEHPGIYRPINNLPSEWRVVSLHLSQDRDSLFLVQHHNATDPLVLKLPMNRQNRREGEEDLFTLSTALQELQNIVSCSNAATQRARHVSGHDEKVTWWTERKELDGRMRRLVENIENHWLGGCKGFLRSSNSILDRDALGAALEKVFREHLICSQDRSTFSGTLDDHVINAFTSIPISCRDEDLEDLIQFAVDCYQINEAPVIGDEVDADQVVCQLREIQKELLKPYSKEASSKQHLFLILDKNLQGFPWEVLPHLRGHSISRIPSLSFLRDRLLALEESPLPSHLTVDPTRTAYILNPSGDLTSTQTMFETWLGGHQGWNGIKNRSPSTEEVKQALETSNLMLYFGHGGAEQYIRSITIKQLPRCAVTMLWGCSSGMLQDQGDFDPSGTPYAYMIAGCPSLVANLWDVTDKDIDRLAMDLFKKTGLHPSDDPNREPVNISQALAESRSVCQLRYLNGAAPVVYGMPVRFTSS